MMASLHRPQLGGPQPVICEFSPIARTMISKVSLAGNTRHRLCPTFTIRISGESIDSKLPNPSEQPPTSTIIGLL